MARKGARESNATGSEYGGYSDAAYMKPRLIADEDLVGRDDSGGLGYVAYTQQWGDGGEVTGAKAHLSVRGGEDDVDDLDEISQSERDTEKGDREGYGRLDEHGSQKPGRRGRALLKEHPTRS